MNALRVKVNALRVKVNALRVKVNGCTFRGSNASFLMGMDDELTTSQLYILFNSISVIQI